MFYTLWTANNKLQEGTVMDKSTEHFVVERVDVEYVFLGNNDADVLKVLIFLMRIQLETNFRLLNIPQLKSQNK